MDREKIEAVFFNVVDDIRDYLPDLTLVGGWMPYIYSNYLWKAKIRNPIVTVDIDFGVGHTVAGKYQKTIFETLSRLGYKERRPKTDRMFPVVLYKEKVPVEFITYPTVDIKAIEKMVGTQIQINKIEQDPGSLSSPRKRGSQVPAQGRDDIKSKASAITTVK
ncbi:MAG: hypothetical protein JW938_04595 [Candidatus Omnitrophica bacterium]|nr:hypothetical protein [Candidatus Omnitrophota bacterium]